MRSQTVPPWMSGGAPRFRVLEPLEEGAGRAQIRIQLLECPIGEELGSGKLTNVKFLNSQLDHH